MFNLLIAYDGTAWETDELMQVDTSRFRQTLGYLDLSRKSPDDVGQLILKKLGRHVPEIT